MEDHNEIEQVYLFCDVDINGSSFLIDPIDSWIFCVAPR